MNYLIVLNDFVGLALKGLKSQKYFIIASFYGIRTKDQKNITASIIPTLKLIITLECPFQSVTIIYPTLIQVKTTV